MISRVFLALLFCGACGGGGAPRAEAPRPTTTPVRVELVESAPLETTLDHPDIANASDVWVTMIDSATRTLDFAEFYASEIEEGEAGTSLLSPVIAAIERAARQRHVTVRFLADAMFAKKYPRTLARLKAAGVSLFEVDVQARTGGVLHAKYFVVDGAEAFVGSQNFDWRSLSHIQEMGVRIASTEIAQELLAIFETDWAIARGVPFTSRQLPTKSVPTASGETLTLVATPKGLLPDESTWELPRITSAIDEAKRSIDVQVLSYKTTSRDGSPFPTLDDALRRALGRGVRVRLLVADWSAKEGSPGRAALTSLAQVPGATVRVITIPPWSGGNVAYARVAHAKYMVIDAGEPAGARAWVGSSNWEGDYFTRSRNVGVIASQGALARRLDHVFEDGFSSAYAKPL